MRSAGSSSGGFSRCCFAAPQKIVIRFAIEIGVGDRVFDRPTPEQRTQMEAAGIASGLGCSIVVTMILLIGGGALVDRQTGTAPIFLLIGVALGLLAAGYQLYELTLVGRKDRTAGPIARQIAKLPVRRGGKGATPSSQHEE